MKNSQIVTSTVNVEIFIHSHHHKKQFENRATFGFELTRHSKSWHGVRSFVCSLTSAWLNDIIPKLGEIDPEQEKGRPRTLENKHTFDV